MFFLPLKDDNPTLRTPYLSWALIAMCCVAFFWQLGLGADGARAIYGLGMVPAALFGGTLDNAQNLPAWMTIFSSMFLHGGFMHLFSNMLFLWIFGDNVEDSIGRVKYLGFYLLCGIAAALTQAAFTPSSQIPMVGASGAIAGVLGGYLMLHPFANVRCIFGIFIFFRIINVPAYLILLGWIALQFLNLGQVSTGGGVAYFAHIGGFIAGVILIFVFKRRSIPLFARANSRAFTVARVTRRSPHLPSRDEQ